MKFMHKCKQFIEQQLHVNTGVTRITGALKPPIQHHIIIIMCTQMCTYSPASAFSSVP